LSEQESIVEILSTLDDKIEIDRRLNQSLEDLASSLFRSWFVDFDPVVGNRDGTTLIGVPSEATALFPSNFADSELGPIPQGWRLVSLSELAELNATTLSAKTIPSAIHYIEISDVHRGDVDRITTYPRGAEPSRARRALRHGDTVVSACALNAEHIFSASILQTISLLRRALLFSHRARDIGRSSTVRPQARTRLITTSVTLRAGHIPLCVPMSSVHSVSLSVVEPVLQQAHANRAEMKTLAELRDTLLGPLLLGELTVKPAEKAVSAAL
jgi:type I restriction enzyme S subunit